MDVTFPSDKNVTRDVDGHVGMPRPTKEMHAAPKGYVDRKSPFRVPTLINSWINYGGDHRKVGYCRTDAGIVLLTGLVKAGTNGANIFVLPEDCRPDGKTIFVQYSASPLARIDVRADGSVYGNATHTSYTSIEGIAFPAAGVADWTPIGEGGSTWGTNWRSYHEIDGTYPVASWWIDPLGRVWFNGLVRHTAPSVLGADVVMFYLPHLSRSQHHWAGMGGGNSFATIDSLISGDNTAYRAKVGTNTSFISLHTVRTVDYSVATNWWDQPLYRGSWQKYASAVTPEQSFMRFEDDMVYTEGLISSGVVAGQSAWVPRGVQAEANSLDYFQPGGGTMVFPINSGNALARTDITHAATEPLGSFLEVTGNNVWRSRGGIVYMAAG